MALVDARKSESIDLCALGLNRPVAKFSYIRARSSLPVIVM